MTIPRLRQVCLDSTPYYHCVSRCVRRAFLCGEDAGTGRSFHHRKRWVEARLNTLSQAFAIDLCAYAVMSNHYHLVVRVCRDRAAAWTDAEVIARWRRLFKGHPLVDRLRRGMALTTAEQALVRSLAAAWRTRLTDLSWFMRCLNEAIARRANAEDGCSGRFWEGRFKSQALLDDTALLTCMSYVDLNPVRAGVASTPEASAHTSIRGRIRRLSGKRIPPVARTLAPLRSGADTVPATCLPFALRDYLELVDWTGRALRPDRPGAIPTALPGILARLGWEARHWIDRVTHLGHRHRVAVGARPRLRRFAERIGQSWVWGCGTPRPSPATA